MNNIAAGLEPLFRAYLKVSGFLFNLIASVMFCIMLAVNAYNIILRSLFDQGTMWHQEISIMAAFWIYFAAYGILAKERGYISVEYFVNRLPKGLEQFFSIFARILTVIFHAVLGYFGIVSIKAAGIYQTPILGWSETIYFVPLLVGTFDIFITESIFLFRSLAARDQDGNDSNSPVAVT